MSALSALIVLSMAAHAAPPTVTEHVLTTKRTKAGREHVVVIAPADAGPDRRYPGLVAMAGLGEARRGNKAGAWGWVEKYGLLPALAALERGALTVDDTHGLIKGKQLARWNAELAQSPYQGLIIVCPYPSNARLNHAFVVEELLPWAEEVAFVTPGAWGIDGISLGGGVSSVIGFEHPDAFKAIGSLQGAITQGRRPAIERAIKRWTGDWSQRPIQIITSRGDGFRPALTDFHKWLDKRRIGHTFEVLPGRHNKAFVQGPGALRMLMFHDLALHQPMNR